MGFYETWSEGRPKIPAGSYDLKCLKAEKRSIWHEGQNAWGKTERVVVWFQIFEGEFAGTIIPMFLTIGAGGRVPQGSKYYIGWTIANGLFRPKRGRLKEMALSKFEGKLFRGDVVDVRPKWKGGPEMQSVFHYSRVDVIRELIAGNPDA